MSRPAKPVPAAAPLVVTANRLLDGRVVWLADDGSWSVYIAAAHVFAPGQSEAALALGQAGERTQHVVGAYTVEVRVGSAGPVPLRFRERLRLSGPSVAAEPSAAAAPSAVLPLAS